MMVRGFLVAVMAVFGVAPSTSTKPMPGQTPPMGWNSWNKFGMHISDRIVREQADAMVSSGMRDAGYRHINLDEGWEGQRDSQGNLQPNASFPDMHALAEYLHAKGLKFGIYTSPGPKACGGSEGSYGHEEQDAKQFAAWGVDYVKYDWCTAGSVYAPEQYPQVIEKMGRALAATGRPMVYSVHGRGAVWTYAAANGATMWRTTGDIRDEYSRMLAIGFGQSGLERYAGPGHWNDPDMLEVGNGGMKEGEYRMHMSLWCLLAAPLIAGNDLAHMSAGTRAILLNHEAIDVDQDPLGVQGRILREEGPIVVMVKPLTNGEYAIGLFNREQGTVRVKIQFKEMGIGPEEDVRDLWLHKDLGRYRDEFGSDVPEHGVVLLRVHPSFSKDDVKSDAR